MLALTTAVGGVLYEPVWWLPFALHAGCTVIAVPFVLAVPEVRQRPADGENQSLRSIVTEAVRVLGRHPMLQVLILFWAFIEAGATVISVFSQDFFSKLRLDPSTVGLILALVILAGAGASVVAHRIAALGSSGAMIFATCLFTVGLLAMISMQPWIAVLGFYAVFLTIDVLDPVLSQFFNDAVADATRATVLSFQSFLSSVMTVIVFVASGASLDKWGYPIILGFLLAVSLPVFGLMIVRSRRIGRRALDEAVPVGDA